jgi:hypothetical protein
MSSAVVHALHVRSMLGKHVEDFGAAFFSVGVDECFDILSTTLFEAKVNFYGFEECKGAKLSAWSLYLSSIACSRR